MMQFSKKEAIEYGWETFKKSPGTLIAVPATLAIPSVIQYFFQYLTEIRTEETTMPEITPLLIIGYLGIFACSLLSAYLTVGLIKFYLQILDGKKPSYRALLSVKVEEFLNYFLGSILYGLITIAGFILLIIPGIIWSIKYQFFSYLILDKRLPPVDAIKESGQITQGHKWNLFFFGIILGLIHILGILALIVGYLVAVPVTGLAEAYVYRKLLAAKNAPAPAKTP